MHQLTNGLFVLLTITLVATLAIWMTNVSKPHRAATLGLLLLWLFFVSGLSLTGAFRGPHEGIPPTLFIPLTSLAVVALLHATLISRRFLSATPKTWPVGIQVFRVGVELAILCLFLTGRAPARMTFEGQNFDILVGLTAPLVVFAMLKLRLGNRGLVAWNIAGLMILARTIWVVLSSTPGPLQANFAGEPFTALGEWPVIWLPAFLAPFAVATHVFSIRQATLC